MSSRVVFDTNTVLSALLFPSGRLTWLRDHWKSRVCSPLVTRLTVAELMRVLAYPKFHLEQEKVTELLADYLPFCEIVSDIEQCPQTCRDARDQIFLNLAHSGTADVLVTADKDLLSLRGQTRFGIETPEAYRNNVEHPN